MQNRMLLLCAIKKVDKLTIYRIIKIRSETPEALFMTCTPGS